MPDRMVDIQTTQLTAGPEESSAVEAASAAGDVAIGDGDLAVSVSGREVPVSMEMLTLLAEEEEEGSQLSDEASSSHVEQQIQVLQEVLQQLSPR